MGYGVCYIVAIWAYLLVVSLLTRGAWQTKPEAPTTAAAMNMHNNPAHQTTQYNYKNHTQGDMRTILKQFLRKVKSINLFSW